MESLLLSSKHTRLFLLGIWKNNELNTLTEVEVKRKKGKVKREWAREKNQQQYKIACSYHCKACVMFIYMHIVYRFLLLWKFVCSFILPLFYLIFPAFGNTEIFGVHDCSRGSVSGARENAWANETDENERRRPCFIVHTRLCIHNMEHRDRTHMLCLLIIFHYFSSCFAICVGCCCCCCCWVYMVSLLFFSLYFCNVHLLVICQLQVHSAIVPSKYHGIFAYCFPHFRIKVVCFLCRSIFGPHTTQTNACMSTVAISIWFQPFSYFLAYLTCTYCIQQSGYAVYTFRCMFVMLSFLFHVRFERGSSSSKFHSILMGTCTYACFFLHEM